MSLKYIIFDIFCLSLSIKELIINILIMENVKKSGAAATAPKAKKSLEAQIEFYHKLHAKVQMRAKFQSVAEKLDTLSPKPDSDFFATDYSSSLKFTFQNERNVFLSISDPATVEEIKEFLKLKVAARVAALDAEILA